MALPKFRAIAVVSDDRSSPGRRRGTDLRLRAVVARDGRRRLDRRAVYRGEGLDVALVSDRGDARGEVIDLTPAGLGLVVTSGAASVPAEGAVVTVEHIGPRTRGIRQRAIVRNVSTMKTGGMTLPRIGLSLIVEATPGGRTVERRNAERFPCPEGLPILASAACPLFFREWLHFGVTQLSAGGMTLTTSLRNKSLLPGLELSLTLMLPIAGSRTVRGTITSVAQSGRELVVGVAWSSPSRELHHAVAEYLLLGDKKLTPARLRAGGLKVGSIERAVRYDYASGADDHEQILKLRLRAHRALGRLENATLSEMASSQDAHSRHITCRFGERIVGYLRVNYVEGDPGRSQYVTEGGHVFPRWLWEAGFVEGGAAAIDPDFQRVGLYIPLLQHTLRVAVQSGYLYLVAAVGDELLSMYEQMGFVVLDSRIVEPKPGWRFRSHLICIGADKLGDNPKASDPNQAMASVVAFVGAGASSR